MDNTVSSFFFYLGELYQFARTKNNNVEIKIFQFYDPDLMHDTLSRIDIEARVSLQCYKP